MEWTKDLPTKPGYYWHRKYKWKSVSIYYVFESLKSWNDDGKKSDGPMWCRWCNEGLYDKQKVEEVGGEWMGPIEPPLD